MKRAWILVLGLTAGCGSSGGYDPDAKQPEAARPVPPPASPKEAEISAARSQLAVKKSDLSQANADLERLAAEREQGKADATRLAEIGALENEAKRKKQALALDIAELEAKLKDLSAGSKQSDDPLAAALEEDAAAEKEKAQNRKAKEEADRSAESRKIAEADAARRAESEVKAKEKVPAGGGGPAGEGVAFEERWAAVILKVRETLQEYKRW
jgi:chromosome segregation ATPase